MLKESKIRILENFLSLDYLFFGKSIHEMNTSFDLAKQYIELKGSLSSVLIEMYRFMDHKPKEITEILNESDIKKMAISSAITARKNVKSILTCTEGKTNILNTVFEAVKLNESTSVDNIVNHTIQEKAFQIGMDNLLIARAINESEDINKMSSFDGLILEDTYKILRNSLIETAMEIIENENNSDKNLSENDTTIKCDC